MFLKYNTVLPSSSPVERVFSMANQILTTRRNRLSDQTFENLLFLIQKLFMKTKTLKNPRDISIFGEIFAIISEILLRNFFPSLIINKNYRVHVFLLTFVET